VKQTIITRINFTKTAALMALVKKKSAKILKRSVLM